MRIEHLAIWTNDLETLKEFYIKYFNMTCSRKYVNAKKQFASYFLSFENSVTRLEIMHRPDIAEQLREKGITNGLAHFSISAGNKQKVNELTELLRKDGYTVKGEPRTTGDGYYESVILDPEGNNIELTE
jgi:lactoylglutathione lyase